METVSSVSKSTINKVTVFAAALGVSVVFAASFASAQHGRAQQPSNPALTGYTKEQCKDGGFQALGFKNQGQCVSFFAKQQNAR